MKATVKCFKKMPDYLKLSFIGHDERGDYGFVISMQRKMGKTIDVEFTTGNDKKFYDYIDADGYKYRKEWLKDIGYILFEKGEVK